MRTQTYDPTIDAFIQAVHEGMTYPLEEMEKLYGSRAEMLAEFTACRVSGDIPLFEEQQGLRAEQQEDDAISLL
jgi:hypothetical protein